MFRIRKISNDLLEITYKSFDELVIIDVGVLDEKEVADFVEDLRQTVSELDQFLEDRNALYETNNYRIT